MAMHELPETTTVHQETESMVSARYFGHSSEKVQAGKHEHEIYMRSYVSVTRYFKLYQESRQQSA